VEEFLACWLYPMAANFKLGEITEGVTPASKLKVSLPKLRAVRFNNEDDVKFLARVELEGENVVGAYSHHEHEACSKCLPSGGRLNRVFELTGVTYGSRLEPRTEANVEASKKRKVDAYGKAACKQQRFW
jgi:hypothetical protein